MFVVHPRKMQEAQYLRGLFPLVFMLLLDSWFATNINADPMPFINFWIKLPPTSLKGMKTRKTISGKIINYKLDSWSQYDNPEEGEEREGDIYQPPKSRKQIIRKTALLWPNGIVKYYVHPSITNNPKKFAVLKDALYTIMSETCIKFVRIKKYAKHPLSSWINITGHKKGCHSYLGRNRQGSTVLNLNIDRCFTKGHAMHEIFHALGVHHEHMRPDRDDYVTIIWENIAKNHTSNFRLLNDTDVTTFELPYDYESIMHYGMTAFSIHKSVPTIIPKIPNVEIGQRSHLSPLDIQKLRKAYNCDNVSYNKLKNNKKKFNLEEIKKLHNHKKLRHLQLFEWK